MALSFDFKILIGLASVMGAALIAVLLFLFCKRKKIFGQSHDANAAVIRSEEAHVSGVREKDELLPRPAVISSDSTTKTRKKKKFRLRRPKKTKAPKGLFRGRYVSYCSDCSSGSEDCCHCNLSDFDDACVSGLATSDPSQPNAMDDSCEGISHDNEQTNLNEDSKHEEEKPASNDNHDDSYDKTETTCGGNDSSKDVGASCAASSLPEPSSNTQVDTGASSSGGAGAGVSSYDSGGGGSSSYDFGGGGGGSSSYDCGGGGGGSSYDCGGGGGGSDD